MAKELNNNKLLKVYPKFIKEMMSSMLSNGNNACYTFGSKKIIMPENNKLALAAFHEA